MSTKPKVPRTVVDKTEDNKLYLSYEYLHELVKVCADAMKNRDFKADAIVAIGAGGFFPGRILRTYTGTPILAVSIQLYDDTTNKPKDKPEKTQWISEGQVEQYIRGKNIIVIDEVDDTRTTLAYCCKELIDLHQPKAVSAMVLINKKKEKRGVFPKEVTYFAGADIEDIWCKFPWDALDVSQYVNIIHLISSSSHRHKSQWRIEK